MIKNFKHLILFCCTLFCFMPSLYAQTGLVDLPMWKSRLEKSKNDSLRAICFTHIAQFYPTQPDSAYYFFEQAREKAKNVKQPFLDLYIDVYIAQYELEVKPYKSLKTYLHAERVMNNMQGVTDKFKFYIYKHISFCYAQIKRTQEAKNYAKKMLTVSYNNLDSLETNIHIFNMADTSDYPQCMEYFYSSMKAVKPLQRPDVEAQLLGLAGNLFYNLKRFKEAESYCFQALRISETTEDSIDLISNKGNIGSIYTAQKYYQKAIPFLTECATYMKEVSKTVYIEKLTDLITCYAGLGDYKKAHTLQQELNKVRAEHEDIEKHKMIAELEAQYELNDKQEQLAAQQIANKLKEERIKVEQQQKYLLLGLFFITLFLMVWALRSYKKQQKLAIDLATQKQTVENQAHELRQLNAMKDKLFAMIGHDLRNPISNLVMLVGDWKERFDDKSNMNKYMNKIHYSLENMQLILNNLLEWATLHIKEMNPNTQKVDIQQFIENMLQQLEGSFSEKALTILNKVKKQLVLVDENQLQIVIRNILSNAVKYSSESGYISISTENVDDKHIKLSIRDTGIGINEDKLKTIFSYPTSTIGTKGEKGTGIGLSLCKELIEKNSGQMTLKSQLNKGTQVDILLPCSA